MSFPAFTPDWSKNRISEMTDTKIVFGTWFLCRFVGANGFVVQFLGRVFLLRASARESNLDAYTRDREQRT